MREGLRILQLVKKEVGIPVTSDIHEPGQAEAAGEALNIIQIPALLCRQTDLVEAAARTGRPLNIKKGQFMAPEDMAFIAEKARLAGSREIWITERGTTFGYHDLVVDMRSIPKIKALGLPVIIDAAHAVQKPGAGRGCSSGEVGFIPTIAKAAVAAGADGVFLEVHDCPVNALSDGSNQLPLNKLEALLARLLKIKDACT